MAKTAIKEAFDNTVIPMGERLLQFPWEQKEAYAYWLAQTYHYVSNSTRLIAFSGSMFNHEHNVYHKRFLQHITEEANHEKLCVTDLKHLGVPLESMPSLATTAGFWQSQIYWTACRGPISFFGYLLCLEGLAVTHGRKFYEKVVAAHGDKAANFLRIHVADDVDHLKQVFDLVKDVTAKEADIIIENMRQSCGLYLGFAKDIEAICKTSRKQPQSDIRVA